jgi:hypothetical protein
MLLSKLPTRNDAIRNQLTGCAMDHVGAVLRDVRLALQKLNGFALELLWRVEKRVSIELRHRVVKLDNLWIIGCFASR